MSSLIDLFNASPEACFEKIAQTLKLLDQSLQRNTMELQKIAEIVDKVMLGRLATYTAAENRRWCYDARLPNKYFDDVFEVEPAGNGFKRWVGASGMIGGTLLLPRALQYDFEAQIVDFATPEARDSFSLGIDGQTYPWLSTADGLYRTIIQEAPGRDELEFSLSIDPATCGPDKVSFSFASLHIEAL